MMSHSNGNFIAAILISMLMMVVANPAKAEPMPPTEEALFGKIVSFAGLHVQVQSNGCTDKKSFKVAKENMAGVQILTFFRISSDNCRAMLPYGTVLTYSFEELGLRGGEEFAVSNIDSAVTVFKPWRR